MLARIQEESIKVIQAGSKQIKPSYSNFSSTTSTFKGASSAANLPLLPAPSIKAKPLSARRLSHKEIEEKSLKEECFVCTEIYVRGHQYKNRQLFSIELIAEDEVQDDANEAMLENDYTPCISLNAIMGVSSYSTMRVKGSIGTKPLHILIDSGSTYNFLDANLAQKIKCPLKLVNEMHITVADGYRIACSQLCENFKWMMQGNWFATDVMVIPLINYDMVLGIQRLQTLIVIVWNFKNLTMKFKVGEKVFELRGSGSNAMTLCSAEKMNFQCQKAKYEQIANPGLLQPLPVPNYIFTDISIDFISGLPKSQGKDCICVVIDRLTKYGHFIPLSHPFSAA
ncbi:hypothetical protein E3N88_11800 [Mikania micrantha]|uniref:Uncharacterized protein n=1 Tax=Mikania micrantha TaxID=192012 RepID=A0A5N6P5H8_9ASTR|nr:hypothetical protein E3N88_11800 [Mikania micrantha]